MRGPGPAGRLGTPPSVSPSSLVGGRPVTSSRPWPSPRLWWTPGTPATASNSWARDAARTKPPWPAAASRSRCWPAGASCGACASVTWPPTWWPSSSWPPPSSPPSASCIDCGRGSWYRSVATPVWPRRLPPSFFGSHWCWSTSTPFPAPPTGSSVTWRGSARWDGPPPHCPAPWSPARRCARPSAPWSVMSAARTAARRSLGLPEDVPLVGVFGGSLGSPSHQPSGLRPGRRVAGPERPGHLPGRRTA